MLNQQNISIVHFYDTKDDQKQKFLQYTVLKVAQINDQFI